MKPYTAKQAAEWLGRSCEMWEALQYSGYEAEAAALQHVSDHIFEVSLFEYGHDYTKALERVSAQKKREALPGKRERVKK